MNRTLRWLTALCCLSLAAGCSVAPDMKVASPEAVEKKAPAVLERSLFSQTGALTEDDMQRVLSSPIDLVFPARVGVVPLAAPFDPAEDPSLSVRSVASHHFAKNLRRSEHFTHVSDISTDLPNVGGIEGLRAIAARYRLRYLVLYSEHFEDETHLNGWAWLYPTLIGMFVAPGVTVESYGIAQADLIDVRTGTVLFSVIEPMAVSEAELMVGAARAHEVEQGLAAEKAAATLATDVHHQVRALLAFADEAARGGDHRAARILPAPIMALPTATVAPPAILPPEVTADAN